MRYTYTITVEGIGIEVYYSYKEVSERWRQLLLEKPFENCTVVVAQEDYDCYLEEEWKCAHIKKH